MEDDRIDANSDAGAAPFRQMLGTVACVIGLGLIGLYFYGSFSDYSAKEGAKTKAIIHAVMASNSTMPGTRMVDAVSIALTASGKYVKVGGWSCNKNIKDGSYDVWLDLVVNDRPERLHWVVDKDDNLFPANDLAQAVSVRQKLKL